MNLSILKPLFRVAAGQLGKGAVAVAGAVLPGIVSKLGKKAAVVIAGKVQGKAVNVSKSGEADAIRVWFEAAPPAAVLVVAAIPVILSLLGWGKTEAPAPVVAAVEVKAVP